MREGALKVDKRIILENIKFAQYKNLQYLSFKRFYNVSYIKYFI